MGSQKVLLVDFSYETMGTMGIEALEPEYIRGEFTEESLTLWDSPKFTKSLFMAQIRGFSLPFSWIEFIVLA